MRVVLASTVMLVSSVAIAQPAEKARLHFVQAQAHYQAGRYDEALAELQAASAADPQPEYLWAIAQAYRLKGDCKRAIPAYGAYLRTGPKPEATKATQKLIDECTAVLERQATEPEPEPTATTAPVVLPPPAEPLVIREVQRVHTREVTLPWYRDTIGNVLVGSGIAVALFGGIAWIRSGQLDDDATTSPTYQQFDSDLRSRDTWQTVGGISFIAGGALIAGGLLHYAVRPKRVRTEVLVDPGTGSAAVSVSWRMP